MKALELKNSAFLLQLVCLASALCIGLLIKHYRITWLHEAGATLLLGIVVGLIIWAAKTTDEVTTWLDFNEEVFFFLLLPPIIFESGFSLQTRDFFNNFGGICALAFAGTMISTFFIGVFVWVCGAIGICYHLSFLHSLVFGALISATDPVTVLAIFQELGVNIDLYSLVFGESVLNDAVAIVMYRTLLQFLDEPVTFVSLLSACGFFVLIFIGSMLVGTFFAVVVTVFFKFMGGGLLESHTHIEAGLVMIAPYCAYTTAEALSLSGIVAILFCGIVMAHYTLPNLSADSQRNTQIIFKVLATLAETFVFIYMGVAMFLESQAWATIPFAVVAIVACFSGRALNVFPVTRQINKMRKPSRRIPKEHIWALWVAGLRGAIAFALASKSISDLGEESGRVIRTATLMIILFTVLTVGGGCHWLVETLHLRAPSEWTDLDIDGVPKGASTGGSQHGGGGEGGGGHVRSGSGVNTRVYDCNDDGPAESLMPEFRIETFEDGMAKMGAHLKEVNRDKALDRWGKVKAAASAVAVMANVTRFEDIDNRFIRPYLTKDGGDNGSGHASDANGDVNDGGEHPSGADVEGGGGGGEGSAAVPTPGPSSGSFLDVPLGAGDGEVNPGLGGGTPEGANRSSLDSKPLGLMSP